MTIERYLLLVRKGQVPERGTPLEVDQKLGIPKRLSGETFELFADDPAFAIALDRHGVAIGSVFPRHGLLRRLTSIPEAAVEGAAQSLADVVLRDYWGNYVAAVSRPEDVLVLRAPLGNLPCFYVHIDAGAAFASDLTTLVAAGLLEPVVIWPEVARALYWRDLPSERTAIGGVFELLPGTALSIRRNGQRRILQTWSPWDHVRPAPHAEPIAVRLKRGIENSVAALTNDRGRLVVGCSGGLDSSIVAMCLARLNRDFTCLTMATKSPVGDERLYAAAVAEACERPLIARHYQLADVDLDHSIASHLPRPSGWIHETAYRHAVLNVARDAEATALCTGNGGDNVFYNSSSARPLIDQMSSGGSLADLMRTLAAIAAMTGSTFHQVTMEAIRVWRRRHDAYLWPHAGEGLYPQSISDLGAKPASHPWLEETRSALPGKAGHVAMLLRMQNHLTGYDPMFGLSVINPLVTQPVVELCLSIPTWDTVAGRIDRSVVRAAFADDLPPLVRDRRVKGSPEGFVIELLEARAGEIRERLLDGRLAGRGLVDRQRLEEALQPAALTQGTGRPDLMALLDTEAWLSRWV